MSVAAEEIHPRLPMPRTNSVLRGLGNRANSRTLSTSALKPNCLCSSLLRLGHMRNTISGVTAP